MNKYYKKNNNMYLQPKCAFCSYGDEKENVCGRLYCHPKKKITAHRKCMQYTSSLIQYKGQFQQFGGFDADDVNDALNRPRRPCCYLCKDKCGCASAGCAWGKCGKSYHFYCARLEGLTSRWRNKEGLDCYHVFCSPQHEEKYHATEKGKGERCIKRSSKIDAEKEDDNKRHSDKSDSGSGRQSSDDPENECEDNLSSPASLEKPPTGKNGRKVQEKPPKDSTPKSLNAKDTINGTPSTSNVSPSRGYNKTPSAEQKDEEALESSVDIDSASSNSSSNSILLFRPLITETSDSDESNTELPEISWHPKKEHTSSLTLKSGKLVASTSSTTPLEPSPFEDLSLPTGSTADEAVLNLQQEEDEMSDTLLVKSRKRQLRSESKADDDVPETSQSEVLEEDSKKRLKTSFPGSCQGGENFEVSLIRAIPVESCREEPSNDSPDSRNLSERDDTTVNTNEIRPAHNTNPPPPLHKQNLTNNVQDESDTSLKSQIPRTDASGGVLPDNDTFSNSGSSLPECLLVIPVDPKVFYAVEPDIQNKMARRFALDEKNVYVWNAIAPVPMPASFMLHFFYDIAQTLAARNWEGLQLLLLDAKTIQKKCDEDYPLRLYQGLLEGKQELERDIKTLVWKHIDSVLKDGCFQNHYLLGELSVVSNSNGLDCDNNNAEDPDSVSGAEYLSLVLNDISDPDQSLRRVFHSQQAIHHLPTYEFVEFAKFDPRIPPEQRESVEFQESAILLSWIAVNFTQLHRLHVLPFENVLRSQSSSSHAFSAVESRLQSMEVMSEGDEDREHSLPVVVLIKKVNTGLVRFEPYLRACLAQYKKEYEHRRVVCFFHVENEDFHFKHCPQINLGKPDWKWNVEFFSAFDPAEKIVSVLIADIS